MLKRLWLTGPYFALLMVTAFIILYPTNHKHNYTEEKKAAVSLNAEGFRVVQRNKKHWSTASLCPLFRLQWMVAFWCGASSSFGWGPTAITDPTFLENGGAALFWTNILNAVRFCQNSRDNTAVYVKPAMVHQEGLWSAFNNSFLIAISWIALLPIINRMLHPSML